MELSDTQTRINAIARAAVRAAQWVGAQQWPDDVTVSIRGAAEGPSVHVAVMDLDAFRAVRRIVGEMSKYGTGSSLYFAGSPEPGLDVFVDLPADTCERVQVGTKEVPVYETRCPESVLALTDDTEGALA